MLKIEKYIKNIQKIVTLKNNNLKIIIKIWAEMCQGIHPKINIKIKLEIIIMINEIINIIKKKVLAMIKIEDLIKIIITIKNNLNLTKEVLF